MENENVNEPENIVPEKKDGAKNPNWRKHLTSWKPGQSGNPGGRKPGELNTKTLVKKWLAVKQSFKNPITEEDEVMTQLDIAVLAMISKARKGSVNHFNALLDRVEGRPAQTIKQELSQQLTARIVSKKELDNTVQESSFNDDEEQE